MHAVAMTWKKVVKNSGTKISIMFTAISSQDVKVKQNTKLNISPSPEPFLYIPIYISLTFVVSAHGEKFLISLCLLIAVY